MVTDLADIAPQVALPASLASRINVHPLTGEWIWGGHTDRDGYGKYGGEPAHRAVWKAAVGPIPPGKVLDHVQARGCTTNACVSPWHLEPVTHRVNVLRGRSFAAVNYRKTRCGTCGEPYDLFNTYVWHGRRDCRACIRRRVREYQRRQRQAA
jgi:HNH endonuclease